MKPIKFRVWDSINDRWFTEYYDVFIDQYGELFSESMIKSDTPNIEIDVMGNLKYMELSLSTGLKDNNGVEIYEGDVITEEIGEGEYLFAEVIYKDGCFLGKERNFEPEYPISDFVKGEVIGNVYQNPELIKNET